MAVENDLFAGLFQLDPVGQKLRIVQMVNVGIHGLGSLIDLFGALRHPLQPSGRYLAYADDMHPVFLAALAPLHQVHIISRLGQRNAFLLENAHIFRRMGAGHVAHSNH